MFLSKQLCKLIHKHYYCYEIDGYCKTICFMGNRFIEIKEKPDSKMDHLMWKNVRITSIQQRTTKKTHSYYSWRKHIQALRISLCFIIESCYSWYDFWDIFCRSVFEKMNLRIYLCRNTDLCKKVSLSDDVNLHFTSRVFVLKKTPSFFTHKWLF